MNQQKNNPNSWVKFSQVGLQMAVTIALCAYGGNFLDSKYPAIAPWGLLGGSLFGVFAALYHVIKQVKAMNSDNDE